MANAKQIVFLGDGGAWVWELAPVNFPQATCILDFYHAAEHVTSLADSLYGVDPAAAKKHTKRGCSLLKGDRIDTIIQRTSADLPTERLAREIAEKPTAYFEKTASTCLMPPPLKRHLHGLRCCQSRL